MSLNNFYKKIPPSYRKNYDYNNVLNPRDLTYNITIYVSNFINSFIITNTISGKNINITSTGTFILENGLKNNTKYNLISSDSNYSFSNSNGTINGTDIIINLIHNENNYLPSNIIDISKLYYGATCNNNVSTLFSIDLSNPNPANTYKTIYTFSNNDISDELLIKDFNNNFLYYGITIFGGDFTLLNGLGGGYIFSVNVATVPVTVTRLYTFNANAYSSDGGLSRDIVNPNLYYGTTSSGGDITLNNGFGGGTIFSIDLSNPTNSFKILYKFTSNAYDSYAGLIYNNGLYYGTTALGGNFTLNNRRGGGTIFSIDLSNPINSFKILYKFIAYTLNNALTYDSSDNNILYGTTNISNKLNNFGTIFSFNLNNNQLIKLYTFNNINGAKLPNGRLIRDSVDNTLYYGFTNGNGDANSAVIYSINLTSTSANNYKVLYTFPVSNKGD
jgi:uncharacterized repeat protein (TIGR03803 family)